MIADIRFWEQKASEGHYAIPHFNVWNAEMLMGVIDAAEELRAPIIISFGTGFTGNTSFEDYCYMMESMAKKATVPVILHWDHGRNWTILKNAVDHCMNSVMRDASALPFEENIAEIKRCVDYFHAYNIPVEAELGHVGNETVYEEALSEYQYTDPDGIFPADRGSSTSCCHGIPDDQMESGGVQPQHYRTVCLMRCGYGIGVSADLSAGVCADFPQLL